MSSKWVRLASGAYAMGLAYLLLAPRPLFFLGGTGSAIDVTVTANVADWIEHGCAYALLAGLFIAAFGENRFTWAILAAILHGVATEALQHFIPLRESSWIDAAANIGAILIVAVSTFVIRHRPSRRAEPAGTSHFSFEPALSTSLTTAGHAHGD